MNNLATVTAFPTGRTPDLGAGIRFLTTAELDRRTREHGKCSGLINDKATGAIHDERWFPSKTVTADEAREACAGCPVIAECLEKAVRRPGLYAYGIFGGTTPEQRQSMRRRAQRRAINMAVAS